MVISLKKHFATEKRPLEYCIETYPETKECAKILFNRIAKFKKIDNNFNILEVGAA
jgi:hypothetical protein